MKQAVQSLDVPQQHAQDFDDRGSDDNNPILSHSNDDRHKSTSSKREQKEIDAQEFIQQVNIEKLYISKREVLISS